jgi:hypothetical protein
MTAAPPLTTVAQTSQVAADEASSPKTTPITSHPSARQRYVARGRGGISRRFRRPLTKPAMTVAPASTAASGNSAPNNSKSGA